MAEPAFYRRRWPYLVLGSLIALSAVCGASLGYFMRFDLPDVEALEDYTPPEMTRVLGADGSQVATFAEQRRILIGHGQVPQTLQQALIATEDSRFYRHTGVDFKGILRALWRDVTTLSRDEGASTLTQQLARSLFLHPQKTVRRKVQEAFLALEIERQYTKQEILRFYCNQIYTGHGRWGVEAAARFYFRKPTQQLSLVETATLAGLIQRPESLSPFKHPDRSLRRRNHVLRRMNEQGMLTDAELAAATAEPLVVGERRRPGNIAPYYVEEVRRWIQERFGSSTLYQAGLEVRTTLDPELQKVANAAMDFGLRQLDKRQGWRGVSGRIPDGESPETWAPESWSLTIEVGQVQDGLVLAVAPEAATVRIGPYRGSLGLEQIAWTKKKTPAELLSVGDVIRVRVLAVDEDGKARLSLEQEPLVEAALVAIEPQTGAIRALVGGFDFERSEFDRAIQAKRQTGSAFKPLIYAAALAEGHTLADTLLDEPTVFLDRRRPEPYQPENYTNKYYETITLRSALEKSANISTVKLLDLIGYDGVIRTARALGIESELQPYPSLALGVFEASLLELTAAYGTFANQGVLVEPHLVASVRDRAGTRVHEREPKVSDAVSPQIAYLMNRVLGGVITDGTGRAAAKINHPLAGKTGTTDDNTDAWFIGYSPTLAVGVWVGFDERRSLGSRETGAQAALPIWRYFMERALESEGEVDFPNPAGITIVAIDRDTGLKSNRAADCGNVISEVFLAGTEPTRYCSRHRHQLLRMPYPFQRYDLNELGQLVIPQADLDRLLASELQVYLIDDGRRIEAYTDDGTISMPLSVQPGGTERDLPHDLLERYDVSRWVGHDGRIAEIVWLR